ncbi:MAG TPA: L-histidine N(alpha)-methyltransferase [Candidatus Eremiobacteraceae bacterium]|nr:L-histidine N(alpha)-methyltransferase [Candidatus Eremiobacteraceae bacterium]
MSFAEDVRSGLAASPKRLPPKYFYDDLGSSLFDSICLLPEYYLTRAEDEILDRHAREIVAAVGSPLDLVELGSGSAIKTRRIIAAALECQPSLTYKPIDISPSALKASSEALSLEYPNIRVEGVAAEYLEGLRRISRNGALRTMVLFLGSNIGNFEPADAVATLRAVRAQLRTGDALLLGADLKKDRTVLESAYDDALGVTAAFNLNVLARINRELGGAFDLKMFDHRARYDEERGRVEMHLVSRETQTVPIASLKLEVHLDRGESIHTESSYKYDRTGLEALAGSTGFVLTKTWTDAAGLFSSNLLRA